MTDSETEASWEVAPADALDQVRAHQGPIVVDFDETLLLGNSTGHFLASLQPGFVAYFLVKLVDLIGRFGHAGDRDRRRVRWLSRLLPWSLLRWRRLAPELAGRMANRPLVEALRAHDGPVVVATMGFGPVVAPLLAEMGLDRAQLVAIDLDHRGDRAATKAAAAAEVLGSDGLSRSLVVTDSLADRALLESSAVPLLVQWPGVVPAQAFRSVYLPGRYVVVKRPKAKNLRRIILDDFGLWVLGSVWLADRPFTHVLGLAVLLASFWAIYELGYLDNDRMAERHEHDPVLSDIYHERPLDVPVWKPLAWAIAAGVVGLWILRWPGQPDLVDYLRWGGVLALTFGVFAFYNRIDKQTRVLLYPLLQLLRGGAFLAVVPTTAIADAALIIMALIRWVSYYIYRTRDKAWPGEDLSAIRLIVFAAAAGLLAAQHEWNDLVEPTTLALMAWSIFLARKSIPRAIRAAHRIDRPGAEDRPEQPGFWVPERRSD